MLCKHSVQTLAHTHARFDVKCMWVSLCFLRSVVIDSYCSVLLLLVLCDWFCLFAFASSDLLLYKVSGSYVHVCPRPCLGTCRWAKPATQPTQCTTNSVCSPRSHAGFGRLTTARMQHDVVISTSWHTYSRSSDCSTQKSGLEKLSITFPQTLSSSVCA